MNRLQDLKTQLSDIEKKISELQISDAVYETIGLLNKRVLLGKKIAQIEWNNLSDADKESKRDQDLISTEMFFQKYPEDVQYKYLYKRQYVLLVQKIKHLANNNSLYMFIFKALLIVLDNADYLNVHDNICLKALFEQIEPDSDEAVNEVISVYKGLLDIPFEL